MITSYATAITATAESGEVPPRGAPPSAPCGSHAPPRVRFDVKVGSQRPRAPFGGLASALVEVYRLP